MKRRSCFSSQAEKSAAGCGGEFLSVFGFRLSVLGSVVITLFVLATPADVVPIWNRKVLSSDLLHLITTYHIAARPTPLITTSAWITLAHCFSDHPIHLC